MNPRDARAVVLIVEGALSFGGSIVSTAALVRAIDKSRFRMIVAMAADKTLLTDKLGNQGADVEVIQVRPLFGYREMNRIRRPLKKVRPRLLQRVMMALSGVLQMVGNIPWMFRIASIVLSRRVDIIQFNNGFGKLELTLVTRALNRIPIVFFRGYTRMGVLDRKLLLPRLHACVSVSEHVKQQAIEDGVDPEIVIVATPPALPEDAGNVASRAEIRARYGISDDALVIAIFGRVITWKGQLEFLKAGAEVIKTVPEARLMVVGGDSRGAYMLRLTEFLDREGIASHVFFTGFVTDVDAHYRAADVIAHASIKPEPSGRVIFEAMSNGVPIVASSLGGPREFIDDGENGYIVDPADTVGFADRMVRLICNPALRKEFAERALIKLGTTYGPESYGKAVEGGYERVLERSRPPRAR